MTPPSSGADRRDANPSPTEDPAEKMDRMYRWTRHVYDLTRRYYLLGRDRLLDRITDQEDGRVLEVGCGTGRNLRVLAETAPHHELYGVDASRAMLATARTALDRAGLTGRVTLAQGLAERLDPRVHLGVNDPLDIVFFSYVLSMISEWRLALARSLSHLADNGRLYVVDFWDQDDLPAWVAPTLQNWLSLFDVRPRPHLLRTLRMLDDRGWLSCTIQSVGGRYAYLAIVEPVPERVDVAVDALLRPDRDLPVDAPIDAAPNPRPG